MTDFGAPSDNTTMTAVIDVHRRGDFEADFLIEETALRCSACGASSPASAIEIQALRRLQGASDPADMAAVLAVTCPACHTGGRRRGQVRA